MNTAEWAVIDAGGTVAAASMDVIRSAEFLIALGRRSEPAERTAILDAVGKVRDVLAWVAALAAGGGPAAQPAPARLPAIRRAGTGCIHPALVALVDARRRAKDAGRLLTALVVAGYRPSAQGRAMLTEMTEIVETGLAWVVTLVEQGGPTDAGLAALIDGAAS